MKNKDEWMDNNIQKLIDNLYDALKNLTLHVNTCTAYRLKMFAIIADAVHLRSTLEKLLDNWCHRLPFVDETGVQIDWDKVKAKFCPFIIEHHPDTTHPLFEKIKIWEEEEMNDIADNSNHEYPIRERVRLSKEDNLENQIANDYLFCNDLKDTTEESIRRFLEIITENKQHEEERLLVYELYRVQLLADNLKAVLRTPSQIISNKEKRDELINEFFKRIQKKCHVNIERAKNDYITWFETFQENMDVNLLDQKIKRYWQKVEMSGFLDDLEKLYKHNKSDNYISLFFDDKGLKKSFAGLYIYTRQLKYTDWKKKTEQFLIFTAVNELIVKDRIELLKKEEAQTIAKYMAKPLSRNELIALSIRQLMKEEDKKSGGKLIKQFNQWIAIQRILVDDYGFSEKPKEFVGQIKEMKLEDIDYPCKEENLKKVYNELLFKEFNKWKEFKEKEMPQKPAFLRQYNAAARLLQILEANKVEKIKKEQKN